MPRKVKDAKLSSRTARAQLRRRPKPYWRLIVPGHHVGYRRHKGGGGQWVARRYRGAGRYQEKVLGVADDNLPADGATVLDFAQAQEKAQSWFDELARGVPAGAASRSPPTPPWSDAGFRLR